MKNLNLLMKLKNLKKSYDIYDLYLNNFYVNDFTL